MPPDAGGQLGCRAVTLALLSRAYVRAELKYGYDFTIFGVGLFHDADTIKGGEKTAHGDSCE